MYFLMYSFYAKYTKNTLHIYVLTVFLSDFGTFLRSDLKFSKRPVESSDHCALKQQLLISLNKLQMLRCIHAMIKYKISILIVETRKTA